MSTWRRSAIETARLCLWWAVVYLSLIALVIAKGPPGDPWVVPW